MVKILAQGAEAIITLEKRPRSEFSDSKNKTDNSQKSRGGFFAIGKNKGHNESENSLNSHIVVKKRIPKSYRLKELDEKLRESRTRKEAKILEKAHKIINVPKVLKKKEYEIDLEYIEGDKLAEKLNSYPLEKQLEVMEKLGEEVAKLHSNDIIHGDLTTSNTIYVENNQEINSNHKKNQKNNTNVEQVEQSLDTHYQKVSASHGSELKSGVASKQSGKVFIIDFGLGFISKRTEDKAVDLHLIKQALEAKHFQHYEKLFHHFKEGYKKNFKEADTILERFKKVEARGRYKNAG